MVNKKSTTYYYSKPGRLTDLSKFSKIIDALPEDMHELTKVVQNIIVHDMWLKKYGIKDNPEMTSPPSCSMEYIIDLLNKDVRDKNEQDEKVIACCRDFSVMLCALLRAKNIPARARCGFAKYLATQGKHEDHWICEFFSHNKWKMVDPQIDTFQLDSIKSWAEKHTEADSEYRDMLLNLDPQNITEKDFVIAGKAWLLAKSGKMDPENFGIGVEPSKFDLKSLSGMWFIRGNLIRDFLSLNKIELSPFLSGIENKKDYWNNWRLFVAKDDELLESDWILLDKIAKLTLEPDKNLEEIQNLYKTTPDLYLPSPKK